MKRAKIIAVVLCVAMLLLLSFVVIEARHEHAGAAPQCRLCMQIEACTSLLRQLGSALVLAFIWLGFIAAIELRSGNCTAGRAAATLISAKVKLTI